WAWSGSLSRRWVEGCRSRDRNRRGSVGEGDGGAIQAVQFSGVDEGGQLTAPGADHEPAGRVGRGGQGRGGVLRGELGVGPVAPGAGAGPAVGVGRNGRRTRATGLAPGRGNGDD